MSAKFKHIEEPQYKSAPQSVFQLLRFDIYWMLE
jgi:hypothetical protein